MNCNTQSVKIASITEKILIVGTDVGSETHYARAFGWCNYEYTKKPLEFSNSEDVFQTFKTWMEELAGEQGKTTMKLGIELTGHYLFVLEKFLQVNGMKRYMCPHHVKKSKELEDNNPNKNDRKALKKIAGLVNEGSLYPNQYLCRDQEPAVPALPDVGRAHEDQESLGQTDRHLLSGVQRGLWGLEGGER